MITLKYDGKGVRHTIVQVPGWAGNASGGAFQPWHLQPFIDAAESGLELVYQGEKCSVGKALPPPFYCPAPGYYALDTNILFRTPSAHSLLLLPHPRYYICPKRTPLVVMTTIQFDWWYKGLTVFFRSPGGCPAHFAPDEPYALLVPIRRQPTSLVEMTKDEVEKTKKTESWVKENRDKYVTREDNEYNIMLNLSEVDRLPEEIMGKKRTIKPRFVKRK